MNRGVQTPKPLKVDVVRPDELGSDELSRWAEIQAADPSLDSPFLSPQFAIAVGRIRRQTRVAILSDTRGVLGFFPFERGRVGFGAALAKGLSDVQAVVAPERAQIDIGVIVRACGLRLWEFDHLLASQRGWVTRASHRVRPERSPAIDLTDGWEAYERTRREVSKSLMQSTARKRRKLERDRGPVSLVFDDPDHARLDQVLRWKSQQYRRTGRRDRFADRATRDLVHELLDIRQPAFGAPLTVLRAGDAVVAGHLGLRSNSALAWWFPVYDPEYGAYSPGLIMCLELARTMPAERLALLDLGKGDEPYKDRLSNISIPLLRGSVAANRLTLGVDGARTWPRERLESMVLASPRLRRWVRGGLAQVGAVRERAARRC
jgi:CelD/BcsL family acetyltransferase involved in cellulose biosynthesis